MAGEAKRVGKGLQRSCKKIAQSDRLNDFPLPSAPPSVNGGNKIMTPLY